MSDRPEGYVVFMRPEEVRSAMERALKRACLVLLSVGLIGVPAGSQQPSLVMPDQRAIPMLVGITATQQRWSGTGVIVGNGIVEGHLACQ